MKNIAIKAIMTLLLVASVAMANDFRCGYDEVTFDMECDITTAYPKYAKGDTVCWSDYTRLVEGERYVLSSSGIPVVEMEEHTLCKTVRTVYKDFFEEKTGRTYTIAAMSKKSFESRTVFSRFYALDKYYPGTQFYKGADGVTVVELFRKDGSLRYRGSTVFGRYVTTSGQCFSRKGKPGMYTSNANNCK